MNFGESEFETGKMDAHKRDFHKTGYYREYNTSNSKRQRKFDYTDSVETWESDDAFVFRIPLSKISVENLNVVLKKDHILIQSNKKTVFFRFTQEIKPKIYSQTIKDNMLLIEVKK